MASRRISLENISFVENVNLGLWLDKFIAGQDDEKKDGEKFKAQIVNQAAKIKISGDYEKFFNRHLENLAEIETHIFKAIEIDSRMIVGLGGESVWENSISIHRTYGVPFIPGSALKGLAASYARKFLKDFPKDAYEFIFGSQESAGFITFHDALLIPVKDNEKVIHADIMTVHHQDYYSDAGKPPADWDSPNPINFISASGKYLLAMTTVEGGESWLEIVVEILSHALRNEGIGAKTSSGYGRASLKENSYETTKMKKVEEGKKILEEKERMIQTERERQEIENRKKEKTQSFIDADLAAKEINDARKLLGEPDKAEKIERTIRELNQKTKKKDFLNLSKSIDKLSNENIKEKLSILALDKIKEIQSENPKVDVPDVCIKSLRKMAGVS